MFRKTLCSSRQGPEDPQASRQLPEIQRPESSQASGERPESPQPSRQPLQNPHSLRQQPDSLPSPIQRPENPSLMQGTVISLHLRPQAIVEVSTAYPTRGKKNPKRDTVKCRF